MSYAVALGCAVVLIIVGIVAPFFIDASMMNEFRRGQHTGAYPRAQVQPKTARDFERWGKSEFNDNTAGRRWCSMALREGRTVWIPTVVLACLGVAFYLNWSGGRARPIPFVPDRLP